MAFTPLPETARRAALDQGSITIFAVILDYATATGGPPANARLNQAQQGIRSDAEATIIAEWPAVTDEPGLATLWSHVSAHAIYALGAREFDMDGLTPDEVVRSLDIIDLAIDHQPTRTAAAGAVTALTARPSPHPDDPVDPARHNGAGRSGGPPP